MTSKRELLEAEDQRWHDLCALIHKVSDAGFSEPGVNGDWTPKDTMAHIAAWHAQTTDRFETLRTTGKLERVPDVNTFNAENYERCKDASLHDVRAMFESSRHRFREEIALLDEPLTERLGQIIAANGHEHYEEHIPQLEAFLGDA